MDGHNIRIRIAISVEQKNYTGGLRLEQEFAIGARDFLEMAKVLGQFDDLAKKIESQNK